MEESWILRAADYSARSRKPRFEVSGDRAYIRCVQGHSADAWSGGVDLDRLYGRVELDGETLLLHGTDISNTEGIVRFGLLPGGGSVTNRVAVHWVEHAHGGLAHQHVVICLPIQPTPQNDVSQSHNKTCMPKQIHVAHRLPSKPAEENIPSGKVT